MYIELIRLLGFTKKCPICIRDLLFLIKLPVRDQNLEEFDWIFQTL